MLNILLHKTDNHIYSAENRPSTQNIFLNVLINFHEDVFILGG